MNTVPARAELLATCAGAFRAWREVSGANAS
jgi:hypothetical protein